MDDEILSYIAGIVEGVIERVIIRVKELLQRLNECKRIKHLSFNAKKRRARKKNTRRLLKMLGVIV